MTHRATGHLIYRVPDDDELPERLPAVLAVVYLVYNGGDHPEAIRLARLLAVLMPDEPEVLGLLDLLLLTGSRRAAGRTAEGALVVLADQDRMRWDRALIEEGQALVRACLRRDQPGPYQLQAAINAVHGDASAIEATDWRQIVALYDHLLALAPTPVVALNRAVAVGEVKGPEAALALVQELNLDGYPAFHAVRADLLARAGRDARAEDVRAAALAPSAAEREFLARGGRGGR